MPGEILYILAKSIYFAKIGYCMCKKYNTKEDAKAAVRKAVSMRHIKGYFFRVTSSVSVPHTLLSTATYSWKAFQVTQNG